MKRICGVLVLVLCFANVDFGVGRPVKQLLESYDDREAVSAEDKDIVYEEGFEVKTILDGHKINVSTYSTFPVPGENYVYAIDMHASEVLKLKLPIDESAQISHFAGSTGGAAGHKDGWGKSSLFNHPKYLTVDDDGNVYVADVRDCVIRKITYDGVVSTIAGESNVSGFADGEGMKPHLSADFDITYISKICSLLISDRGNKRLRLIQLKRPEICRNGQNARYSTWINTNNNGFSICTHRCRTVVFRSCGIHYRPRVCQLAPHHCLISSTFRLIRLLQQTELILLLPSLITLTTTEELMILVKTLKHCLSLFFLIPTVHQQHFSPN